MGSITLMWIVATVVLMAGYLWWEWRTHGRDLDARERNDD